MLMCILNDIPRQLTVAFVLPLPVLRALHEDRPVISRQLFEVLQLSGTAVAVRGVELIAVFPIMNSRPS